MKKLIFYKQDKKKQYMISVLLVCTVSLIGLFIHNLTGYRVVAFMLLVTVSFLAMSLDILPVLVAALLSALIWDFFFIPPRFTLTVGTPEDRILLSMYFIIALINAVLTFKIRQIEKEVKLKDEKANAVKFYNTLFNSLSHELRTPITTIIGCTDNLQSNTQKLSDANRAELLAEISVASLRLNQLVENLLNVSRIESGVFQVKKDWCDISELIYKTLQRLEPNLQHYRIDVHIPEHLPLFRLDFGLMEQVIYNLIINVTQHTSADTQITIHATGAGNTLVLTVADNGNGFPEDEIGKVFNKFHRVKGSGSGGTGLGLSIVKGFVEAHLGTVKLENLPVRGSKFTIEIPTQTSNINRLKNE